MCTGFKARCFLRSIAIALTLVLTSNSVALAAPKQLTTDQAKQKVFARGIGNGIKVTQANGPQVVGIITGIRGDDFDVTAKGTTQSTPILYANVTALHNQGSSVGKKIGTGVIIGTVAMTVLVVIAIIGFAVSGR
jgi:hypothetical protein